LLINIICWFAPLIGNHVHLYRYFLNFQLRISSALHSSIHLSYVSLLLVSGWILSHMSLTWFGFDVCHADRIILCYFHWICFLSSNNINTTYLNFFITSFCVIPRSKSWLYVLHMKSKNISINKLNDKCTHYLNMQVGESLEQLEALII
jgi:hypothetical protein